MKFWITFKSEISEIWNLVDEEGRVSNVNIEKCDKDAIVIEKG